MSKQGVGLAIGISAITLVFSALVFAQEPGAPMRATIPFSFSIGKRILPAGEYQVKRINDEGSSLEIENLNDSHEHVLFETETENTNHIQSKGSLVFDRYGDRYFLHEVWSPGRETGRELFPSKEERLVKREMAKNESREGAEMVTVAVY